MSVTSDILRGHTEAIILSHLIERDSYGYQINKDIMKKTDNKYELKEATLYSVFRRLEQADFQATTTSGDVNLLKVVAEHVDISTVSGELSVQEVSGDVKFSTTSGDIAAQKITGNMKLSTTSGRL